jgi:hypothetical protein
VNIILALVASFTQITLGLVEAEEVAVICFSLALATAFLLGCSVLIMWQNFRALYRYWESQAQEQLDKKWKQSLDEHHGNTVEPQPGDLPEMPTVRPGKKLPDSND